MMLWCFRAILALVVLFLVVTTVLITSMPGKSYRGPRLPSTADESVLSGELRRTVVKLATEIGERSTENPTALNAAADFVQSEFESAGYAVERQPYDADGLTCYNLAVELPGTVRADEILIIGAHYDTVPDCPGANDNASAVAALLALARYSAHNPCDRTLRLVAFANEEPPHFWSPTMGSLVYARRCRERGERVVGMITLETLGYYSDQPGSQRYPWPFSLLYPSRGDFLGFVGNLSSRQFVRDAIGAFRQHARFASEGAALPGLIQEAGWSDHWSFWQQGYPALMVTDTAPFRYPYYHTPQDTPDKLDYDRLARVVVGLRAAIRTLATVDESSR